MVISNSTTSEVILNIENDPSRNDQNYNLNNRRILTRKIYFLILIQYLVRFLFTLIFCENDLLRQYSLTHVSAKFLVIISGICWIICIIVMFKLSRSKSKTFNLIILSIFTISNGVCFAISVASYELNYHYYISDLLTSLILFGLFLLANQNKRKISLVFEVIIIVIFYFTCISVLIYSVSIHTYSIDRLVTDCLFLNIIVIDTYLILKKYDYQLKSNDYIFVISILYIHIQIICLIIFILMILIIFIFGLKVY